jgi:DNA-binding PadR family transcriptional regulator
MRRLSELDFFVILAILQLGKHADAPAIRTRIAAAIRRPVGRGTLYRALDRLAREGLLTWRLEPGHPGRADQPLRHFTVTESGVTAARGSRFVRDRLWSGLEDRLT